MKKKLNITANTKGLFLMLLGQLSFAINDTIVKYMVKLSENDFSTLNIIFIRGIFTSTLVFLIIIFFTKNNLKDLFLNKISYLRGLFEVLTALFFFAGLVLMPMANVYTLLMTAPFIVTLYAFFFLNEKVGIRRWSAVILGFVGAFFLNINIEFSNLIYIFISSLFLTSGYICSVLTIIYAPLSLTASIRYSVIVFGIILGYLILGETPSLNMLLGAIIISASGLFVIKREKDLGKII